MLETSLNLLKKIEENGYEAYIVGGFVRDYLLGVTSLDVDINTSATPQEIKRIFKDACLPNEDYGSVTVIYDDVRFEITTYRKDFEYIDNRRPSSIEYIDDLKEDLKRRDFTINTLCMNSKGKIVDHLNGKIDLDNKLIVCVNNSFISFSDDALRILRAIRFATVLNFKLVNDVKKNIIATKGLLKNLSYNRKKEELNKIFTSNNLLLGISLIKELQLDYELELYDLDNITNEHDLLTIWLLIDKKEVYPYTKNEKNLINQIKKCLNLDNTNNNVLYHYGLFVNLEAAIIKGLPRKIIVDKYNELPIKSQKDIDITGQEILEFLNILPSKIVKEIFVDLENKILSNSLINEKDILKKYIISKYKTN
ncbi:MAG: hypothetical protein GX861_02570 [Tenericutes bacterium]|nr:hypothetical protein [Mycoplasmatota bacterium]